MENQQSNPHLYTQLNETFESNPNVHLHFNKTGSEDRELVAHYRSSASGSQAVSAESFNERQEQADNKGWSTCFGVFYGFVLLPNIFSSGSKLIVDIYLAVSQEFVINPLEFVVEGWLMVLCILAFSGFWKRILARVEKAVTMIKIHYPLKAVYYLSISFQAQDVKEGPEYIALGVFMAGVLDLIFFTLLIFLTTRKVRNTLRLAPKEELLEEDCDPIEKLDSFIFKIYKAVLLILFLWDVKVLIQRVCEDFLDFPKFFGKLMAEKSYLMLQIQEYSLLILSLIFLFVALEGMRRRNLEKVLNAIRLMKIYTVARLVLSVLKVISAYHEGKLLEEFQQRFPGKEIEGGWSLLCVFLINEVVCGGFLSLHVYFASKVRDILKDHQKAGHIL